VSHAAAEPGSKLSPGAERLLRELNWLDQIEGLDDAIAVADRLGKMEPSTIGFTVDGRCPPSGQEVLWLRQAGAH
jgi:hypothetical protein